MSARTTFNLAAQDETGTRLGRVAATGFVRHRRASIPRRRRVSDTYRLCFIADGFGSYTDDITGSRPLGPGDAILVVPGHSHWFAPPSDGGWDEMFLFFDGPVFDALASGGVLDIREPVRRLVPVPAWQKRIREFAARSRPNSVLAGELEILELAALLVELRGGVEDARPLPQPIRRACDLLAADLTRDLDLHDVAATVGVPYETFRRRFRTLTGISPDAFRLDRRIEAAQAMLRMTAMTHATIAASLGFADERHLAKRFQARVGTSPRTYRQANTPR